MFRDFVADKLVRYAPGADIHRASGHPVEVVDELPLTRAVLEFADMIRKGNSDRANIDLALRMVDLIKSIDAKLKT